MKKIISLSMMLMMVTSIALTGCGSKDVNTASDETKETKKIADSKSTVDEKKSLSIFIWDKEEVIAGALDLFKKENTNVELEVFYTDNKQYDNVLSTKLASGEGPDIMQIGANAKKLAQAGRLMDITGQDFIDKYHASGTDWLTIEGKNYGVPWMSWMEGIFYNKDLFAQAGIENTPKTWNEFIDAHEKLQQAGIKPQTMGAKSWEPMMKQSMALVISGFYQKEGNKDWGLNYSEGSANMSGNWDEYVKEWSKIVSGGYLTPVMLGMDYDQAQDEFATGKAAMWESGNWAVSSIETKNPELNYGFFPIPAIEGEGFLVGGAGSGWVINADTEQPELATEFLRLWSTEEAQLAAQKVYGGGVFLKGVKADLPASMEGANEALAAGRIFCPWNEWYGAQAIITEYGKAMQDYLSTEGQDEEMLLEVLTRSDAKRDQMLQSK